MSVKRTHKFLIILLILVLTACSADSPLPGVEPNQPTAPLSNPEEAAPVAEAQAKTGSFSAEAQPSGSIALSWQPQNGASGYLVEWLSEDEVIPLARLDADATAYTFTDLPGETEFTLRLTSLNGSGRGDSSKLTVRTLPEQPDPISVSPELDISAPLMDFSNLDFGSLDDEDFDDEDFNEEAFMDPANFMPQPVESSAEIGPEGGLISLLASNGMAYTLVIPANALREVETITLKAITAIPDLPLNGDLSAAVLILPDTLSFDLPASLTITPPEGYPAPTGEVQVGFSFMEDGQDFHLYPLRTGDGSTATGAREAKLLPSPLVAPPLSDIAEAYYGGGYGLGSASTAQVKEIAKKSPRNAQSRTAQKIALAQMDDDLTPLLPPGSLPADDELAPLLTPKQLALIKVAESIRQQVSNAQSLSQLMVALEQFKTYLNEDGSKTFTRLNDRIINLIVESIHVQLAKNKAECLSKDDYYAQELVDQLLNPINPLAHTLSERYKKAHGQKLLTDLAEARKSCTYKLSLTSKLTFTSEGSTMTTTASAPEIILRPVLNRGEIFLKGKGTYKSTSETKGQGCNLSLIQYPSLTFRVHKLTPIFKDDIADYNLEKYSVEGMRGKVKGSGGQDCEPLILDGGGDFWISLFSIARISLGNREITGWGVTNSEYFLSAVWHSLEEGFPAMNQPGTVMTENTMFELEISKN